VWGLLRNKRHSSTRTTLLRRNVSFKSPPFVKLLPSQIPIPSDSRRSTVAVVLFHCVIQLLFGCILRFCWKWMSSKEMIHLPTYYLCKLYRNTHVCIITSYLNIQEEIWQKTLGWTWRRKWTSRVIITN
jgi:hypothetical protein